MNSEKKKDIIEKILYKARQASIAVVGESFIDFDDADEVYTPDIDYDGAIEILRIILQDELKDDE